jgi:hypothetical protein
MFIATFIFKNLRLLFSVSLHETVACCRAGKPPVGLHLDVLKGDKLIQVQDLELTCL